MHHRPPGFVSIADAADHSASDVYIDFQVPVKDVVGKIEVQCYTAKYLTPGEAVEFFGEFACDRGRGKFPDLL